MKKHPKRMDYAINSSNANTTPSIEMVTDKIIMFFYFEI
jgi:hypothetical protein